MIKRYVYDALRLKYEAEIKEAALVLFIGIGILILLAGGFTLWYVLR